MECFIAIAKVLFSLRTNQLLLPVYSFSQEGYRQFVYDHKKKGWINEIEVYLTDDPVHDIQDFQKIFDSNSSWSLYSCDGDYYVMNKFPSFQLPVWSAHISSKTNCVTINCNPEIIDPASNCLVYNPLSYPLDQILLMNYLADHQGSIIHSTGWVLNNMGWMFAGKSGAGKSTIAKIFHQKKNGLILSDDRVVVRQIGNDFVMHGSPWPGDAGFAENRSAFINGIVFLRKGSKNQIVEISSTDALSRLMPVISIPWYDKEKVEKMMAFCEIFIKKIPMYELTFRADDSVADYMEMFINAKKAID